jgi:spore coat protein CotH
MKRHLLLFSVLFILLIGCKEEQITKFVTITDKSYSLPSEGGVFDVMLMGNGEYSIETSPANLDWILVSESNSSEPEKIIFDVKPNFSTSKRSATVIIKTASNDISVYVEQYPGSPAIVNSSISKFKFSVDDNKMQIINDIEFKIEDNRITGRIPYYTKLESLIARFETNASMVKVGETIQISGVTANNFVEPVEYTVLHEDGSEETYTVEVTNFTGLPVLFIYTDNKEPIASKDNYVNGTIFFDGAGEFENLTAPMRIKGRGNSTWSMPKKPYRIKFDEKQSMAGFPANKDWVLLANYADKTSLRTEVAFNISRNTSLEYTPRTQHVEVFINDVYNGTYVLTEQLKIGKDRINVTDDGYLLEVDQLSRLDEGDVYFTTDRILLNIKDPDVELNSERYNWIRDFVIAAENALYGVNFKDPQNGYAKYIDVGSFVDWYLVNEITKNNDAKFFSSCYMNITPGGKLKMGPVWDYDLALGNVNYNNNYDPTGFWIKNSKWISRLFEDPAFVELVKERYNNLRGIILNNIIAELNQDASYLSWSMIENNNKWGTLYTYTWPNDAIWGSYNNEIQYLKTWLSQRISWLDKAINDL